MQFNSLLQRRGSSIVQKRGSQPHAPQRRGSNFFRPRIALADAVSSANVMQEEVAVWEEPFRAECS